MIYLASPYSHPNPAVRQERFEQARAATAGMLLRGEVIYSPIVHSHTLATAHEMPADHEFWMNHCIEMLRWADGLRVLMLDGWQQSRGVREEIEWWRDVRGEDGLQYVAAIPLVEFGH